MARRKSRRRKGKRRVGYHYVPRKHYRHHRKSMLHDGKRVRKSADVIYVKGKGLYERIRRGKPQKSYPVYRSAHYEEKEED